MGMKNHTAGRWALLIKPSREGRPEDGFLTEAFVGIPASDANGHNEKHVAEIFTWGADFSLDSEAQANARLIAAAPALLANLEQMDRLIRQFIAGDLLQFPASALFTSAEALKEARGEG